MATPSYKFIHKIMEDKDKRIAELEAALREIRALPKRTQFKNRVIESIINKVLEGE